MPKSFEVPKRRVFSVIGSDNLTIICFTIEDAISVIMNDYDHWKDNADFTVKLSIEATFMTQSQLDAFSDY